MSISMEGDVQLIFNRLYSQRAGNNVSMLSKSSKLTKRTKLTKRINCWKLKRKVGKSVQRKSLLKSNVLFLRDFQEVSSVKRTRGKRILQ